MLKIWGRTNSVNVKKALWAAEELGLKYERVDAGLQFGVVDTPEYRKLNPNGLVPTIEDDGFVLWESNAIVRYLAAKYGAGTLWPNDLRQRADADRWMDWAFSFANAFRPVFWGLIRTPPEKRDLKAIEDGRKKTIELAAIADARLALSSRAISSPWATSRSAATSTCGSTFPSSGPACRTSRLGSSA
jgi:glutathione S-transferase